MRVIIWIITITFAIYLARQVQKPNRWLGRPFVWLMNRSHSTLTDWGLTHVTIQKNFRILDIGCGGGRTIEKLAAIAKDGVFAVLTMRAGASRFRAPRTRV